MPDDNQPQDLFSALNGGAPLHPGVGPEPHTTLPALAPSPAPAPVTAPVYSPPPYAPPPQPGYAPGYPPPPGYSPHTGYATPPGYVPQPAYAPQQPGSPRGLGASIAQALQADRRRETAAFLKPPSFGIWLTAALLVCALLGFIFGGVFNDVAAWAGGIAMLISFGTIINWFAKVIGYFSGRYVGRLELPGSQFSPRTHFDDQA